MHNEVIEIADADRPEDVPSEELLHHQLRTERLGRTDQCGPGEKQPNHEEGQRIVGQDKDDCRFNDACHA